MNPPKIAAIARTQGSSLERLRQALQLSGTLELPSIPLKRVFATLFTAFVLR